jgi:hypothetical protein
LNGGEETNEKVHIDLIFTFYFRNRRRERNLGPLVVTLGFPPSCLLDDVENHLPRHGVGLQVELPDRRVGLNIYKQGLEAHEEVTENVEYNNTVHTVHTSRQLQSRDATASTKY